MTDVVIRTATAADAPALHALITAHQSEGHLLPRDLDDVRRRASRFVVCDAAGTVTACAELAPLSSTAAEIRSLVVSRDYRRVGIAARLINELRKRALSEGFRSICAFTHDARFFVRQNFSIVPHVWLREKIVKDCLTCPLFKSCGQYAMLLPLHAVTRYGTVDRPAQRVAVA